MGLAIAFAGGIAASLAALEATRGFGTIVAGPWRAFPDVQTDRADPYARAHRARRGALLLGTAEGLVFAAEADDTGRPLDGACIYRLSGMIPPARFWTLHPSDTEGDRLTPPPARPGVLHSTAALRQPSGAVSITIGRQAAPGNWLALADAVPFRLVLTLFDTPAAADSGVSDIVMPAIERQSCDDA